MRYRVEVRGCVFVDADDAEAASELAVQKLGGSLIDRDWILEVEEESEEATSGESEDR